MTKTNFFSKVIAFVTAGALTLSALPPVNSFASSTNRLSNGNLTVSEKTMFYEPGIPRPQLNTNQSTVKYLTEGNYLNLKLDDAIAVVEGQKVTFDLELENSKFVFKHYKEFLMDGSLPINGNNGTIDENGVYTKTGEYTVTCEADDYATVELLKSYDKDDTIKIPMVVRMNEKISTGTAKVRIIGGNSGVSSSTLSLATINKGSTTAYVNDYQTARNKIVINELVVKENVAGSMSPDDNEGFYLELPNGYYFDGTPELSCIGVGYDDVVTGTEYSGRRKTFKFNGFRPSTSQPGRIVITGLSIMPKSSSESITREDVKISIDNMGSKEMVTAQEFKAGVRADYGMSFKTKGSVPTLLNGFYDEDTIYNEKVKSAKLVVSEETVGSLISGGDMILTLSDGAKMRAVKIEDKENIDGAINGTYELGGESRNGVEVKENKVTLKGLSSKSAIGSDDKAEFTISFYLSIEPGYVGDVSVKVTGDAMRGGSGSEPVVIAKAINPVSVKPKTTYFTPGQTFVLDDIVLTEQLDGKGTSSLEEGKEVHLGFQNNNNYLSVVGTPRIETENGLKVKSVKTSGLGNRGIALSFTIDEASSKNKASKITISGLKIASSSSTPKGVYSLVIGGPAVAGNSSTEIGSDSDAASFSSDGITVANLQYGGAVAMKITIGSKVVTVDGQEVEMKIAPFIDSATGTTYMQVSDIVRATGRNCSYIDTRLQEVDGLGKNLYVTFGDRTFEKDKSTVRVYGQAIPETMTNEQGVAVNMIVKDDYTCLPLRYFVEKVLGQKINWNGVDNTITIE